MDVTQEVVFSEFLKSLSFFISLYYHSTKFKSLGLASDWLTLNHYSLSSEASGKTIQCPSPTGIFHQAEEVFKQYKMLSFFLLTSCSPNTKEVERKAATYHTAQILPDLFRYFKCLNEKFLFKREYGQERKHYIKQLCP